ncbi:MAG: hypothetical protein ACK4GN_13575 [Runella sp.]
MLPQKITLYFETSAQLPPPYSYQYSLELRPTDQSLEAHLILSYTHREDLEADEIEAEGFTANDDYEWKGALEKVWKDELEKLWKKTETISPDQAPAEQEDLLLLQIIDAEIRQPKNKTEWLYVAQELMQAVYETSGKERPFELQVINKTPTDTYEAVLTASFKNRTAQLKRIINGKSDLHFFAWKKLPVLMETLYEADWLSDMAKSQKPTKAGLYLSLGDGLWYEWGKQIVAPSKGSKALEKIKKAVLELLSV